MMMYRFNCFQTWSNGSIKTCIFFFVIYFVSLKNMLFVNKVGFMLLSQSRLLRPMHEFIKCIKSADPTAVLLITVNVIMSMLF